ncbi:MAG: LOG family protein [Candidatus Aminicenantaceae bacterium]
MNKPPSPLKAYENLDFLKSDDARIIRILSEYLEPLTRLREHKVNNTVLFFGSARAAPENSGSLLARYYGEAEELAYLLARWAIKLKPRGKNFVICTGGGGGIMEAANRGADRAGGKSIGMNISLPMEQAPNSFISPELAFEFHYFFMRKFWLVYMARAIVAFPGGYGTLDEIFEVLTLTQTEKIDRRDISVLLYGEEYWREILNLEALAEHQAINPEDLKLFRYSSDPQDAFEFLKSQLLPDLKSDE